ncbi:MAG: DUF4870 domain-containing protein [Acidobacteria bacterium]|jgi:uncharacterized membrane protein|nr:DUF4870 domain-containing protein [Acidobacteriota bacterium]
MAEETGVAKPYSDEDKIHLFLAYFGIFALIPFLMFKDKRSDPQKEYVYWHARQGLALAIVVFVLCIVFMVAGFVLAFIPVVGWILSCLMWVCLMIIAWGGAIMGWVKAFGGQKWEMPGIAKVAAMFN